MMPVTRIVLCTLIGCAVALTSTVSRSRDRPEIRDVITGFAGAFVAAIALGVD